VIPPKAEAAFKRQFNDWLDLPVLHEQRLRDKEPAQPEPYYHWIQGGVDFISLDNPTNVFPDDQIAWLGRRLDSAKINSEVKSVVGMHEALPDSIANYHSMGDIPAARPSGERVYKALVGFRDQSRKPVYVLASHSHFYMENIFETPALKANGKASSRLDCRHGWGGALQAAQRRSVDSETRRLRIFGCHSCSRRHNPVFV